MSTSEEKWRISIFSAALFLTVVHPMTFQLTNSMLEPLIGTLSTNGCPTTVGLFIHTIVFVLLVRYSMDLNIV
ncbi:hypothetical protein crov081 [Cafeteria roenbergensis virus]|uniref:Uncharacterized protein n=1 Tax=Cafeteria roenbergensis virus (strain BV-PW1) TaxID=693272 RepID=E3T4K1_CROVB|nr:hypothetical protein crov081 [Cafeteria roenbergensis virus BV-PW1]ADO67114.1 hypothetical protein crov081 [Cafeteria roenbergensis virus BV-PW1]